MPVRHLNFQGYNPYRNLVSRDPAINGLANLGAALYSGASMRADARKKAFDEEEKKSHDLFNENFQMSRGRAQDEDRAQTHRDAAGQRQAQAAQLKETFQFHKQVHDDSVSRLKTDSALRDKMLTTKSSEARADADRKARSQQETTRHNMAMEKVYGDRTSAAAARSAAPKVPVDKSVAAMATDIWNRSRQASYTKDHDGNSSYDPILHQQNYNKLRDLSGRTDVPQWKDAQGSQSAPAAPIAPAAAPEGQSFLTPRRSGQSGVHTLGDVAGGVVDLWNGPSDKAAPVPQSSPAASSNGMGVPSNGMFGDAAPVAPPGGGMPTHAEDMSHPAVQQMADIMKGLHPKDQEALQRIIMSKDPTRIAAAQDRLMKMAGNHGSAAPTAAPMNTPAPAMGHPPENEASDNGLFDGEPDASADE